MRSIILIVHNIRSCHNVGALLRTADGLGVDHVYLTGYTPYPLMKVDSRLPHLARKIDAQIHKTALDAERTVAWTHHDDVASVLADLKTQDYAIAALEQHEESVPIPSFHAEAPIALIVGREVEGIEPEVLAACDLFLEIPMFGKKESFNVASAAAMALYHLRFLSHP
jgi:23S rRNA (guanosine2251-2'-O)-methyltransferase